MPLFVPGQVVATRGALAVLDAANVLPQMLLLRHCAGDWGDLGEEDVRANANALAYGGRLLSKYVVGKDSFYIITEADRSATTLLLTHEY